MTKEQFNSLNEQEQWKWVLNNKDKGFKIELDNDTTYLIQEQQDWYATFKADLGNREGVEILLGCLGIKVACV